MKNKKMVLQALVCFVLVLGITLPAAVAGASSARAQVSPDCLISHSADSLTALSAMTLNTPQRQVTPMVAAGYEHIVGLKADSGRRGK